MRKEDFKNGSEEEVRGAAATRKALAGIEKAHKDLQLNIKNLKASLGGGVHHPEEAYIDLGYRGCTQTWRIGRRTHSRGS